MSNRHYCVIGDHPPGKGVRHEMVKWERVPVTYKDGAWHYNPDSTTLIQCCPRHRPIGYVPSPDMIHEAFHQTADAISGDMFALCKDDVGEFQLDRDTVADYLDVHGSTEVMKWFFGLEPEKRDEELDLIGVPKYWV